MGRRTLPTHGPDNGRTRSLEPQRCGECGTALEIVRDETAATLEVLVAAEAGDLWHEPVAQESIACPNGHEV
jgi:hypothetical protein